MSYRVETISSSRGIKDFLRLPFEIYRNDPDWIAPLTSEVRRTLDPNRNPYFARARCQLFVCYRGKDAVARTSVVINPQHWEKYGEKVAFFGFFESLQDDDATSHVFEAVEEYCRSAGAEFLEGPFNPHHYSELGLQTDRFGVPPVFFETYNPEYYPQLLSGAGFRLSYSLHTRRNPDVACYVRERYGARKPLTNSGGFTARHFNMHCVKAELERIREVYNDAFSDNWHFLPLSCEEYLFSARFLRLVTYPELITIIEHRGEPVGVLQCVLDVNQLLLPLRGRVGPLGFLKFLAGRKKVRDLVIYAIGIKKAYRNTRAFKIMLDSMCSIALKYRAVSTTWMSDNNWQAVRASDYLGLQPYKQFAIYGKSL